VPFEEDHSQGKDRPVLVIGHDGPWLLALPHNRDRDSEVRVDRILRVDPHDVRRLGANLDEGRFNQVATALRRPKP
jgi:mRNA-degrading endonuclease toxin of MazEF toxin-antitoxin module